MPFTSAADAALPLRGFKAYKLDAFCNPVPPYNRLDFYKVNLVTGHIVVQYADCNLELNGTHLFFANPRVLYATLLLSAKVAGYACLFTEAFGQANCGRLSAGAENYSFQTNAYKFQTSGQLEGRGHNLWLNQGVSFGSRS